MTSETASTPVAGRKVVRITAVEEDDDDEDRRNDDDAGGVLIALPDDPFPSSTPHAFDHMPDNNSNNVVVLSDGGDNREDIIPGPPPDALLGINGQRPSVVRVEGETGINSSSGSTTNSERQRRGLISRVLNNSQSSKQSNKSGAGASQHRRGNSAASGSLMLLRRGTTSNSADAHSNKDELQLSLTEHRWSGAGILASRADLDLPPEQFAAGCNLLQAAARGDRASMEILLNSGRTQVNFRDYDRRTALHVAASEGHVEICQYLVEKGARINRSDRWGGSPLDDAHRHRHTAVIRFLRQHGANTGSGNRATNLITAAADGDIDEVMMLLQMSMPGSLDSDRLDVNKGDYDKRTALHLSAGEGHLDVVKALCEAGADVNAEDRWQNRPLDDALRGNHVEVARYLEQRGAAKGAREATKGQMLDASGRRSDDNMKVEFTEIEMIDRIGAGAFGEIYKCRWRGTLVAVKIIKSAKIRRDWVNKRVMESIKEGKDVDEAIKDIDEAELEQNDKDIALADFRQEISVLKSLRHPHIVLLLAYSTTENYECLISELMKCSLLDVFKSHLVQGTRMTPRTQILYATQLSLGMNYLHTCKPPIIHRDLKPANLLIDFAGVLKISDFGLSKVRPDPGKKETDTFTMTGETGSYRFMAPEVFKHQHYNETVDIYSFAMILFYLLVGRPPWPNLPGMDAVKKASEEGDRPNLPRDLDIRMQNLLRECWDDNPSRRPPFSRITTVLSNYNYDVFNQDINTVVTPIPPEIESDCNCAIL